MGTAGEQGSQGEERRYPQCTAGQKQRGKCQRRRPVACLGEMSMGRRRSGRATLARVRRHTRPTANIDGGPSGQRQGGNPPMRASLCCLFASSREYSSRSPRMYSFARWVPRWADSRLWIPQCTHNQTTTIAPLLGEAPPPACPQVCSHHVPDASCNSLQHSPCVSSPHRRAQRAHVQPPNSLCIHGA